MRAHHQPPRKQCVRCICMHRVSRHRDRRRCLRCGGGGWLIIALGLLISNKISISLMPGAVDARSDGGRQGTNVCRCAHTHARARAGKCHVILRCTRRAAMYSDGMCQPYYVALLPWLQQRILPKLKILYSVTCITLTKIQYSEFTCTGVCRCAPHTQTHAHTHNACHKVGECGEQ